MVESLKGEVWKVYPHDVRYKVSNFGRVIGAKGFVLKQIQHPMGYLMVHIGKHGKILVHRAVMETFDPAGQNEVVCHNDGDKQNNHVENLRWDTQQGNLEDRNRHGTMTRGERSGGAKLSNNDVIEIKKLLAAGLRQCEVMRLTKANRFMIHKIATNQYWSHINA